MSDASTSMLVRFLALPRAVQWALLAAIGVGLFLVWDSWIAPLKDDLDKKSSVIEAQVRESRGGRPQHCHHQHQPAHPEPAPHFFGSNLIHMGLAHTSSPSACSPRT